MAPRTRTRQRKERHKWTRNHHRSHEENRLDKAFALGHGASPNGVPDTTTSPGEGVGGQNIGKATSVTLGSDDKDTNRSSEQQNDHKRIHPPDCICILRKQFRGKTLALPPPSLSLMEEYPDNYYCLETSFDGNVNWIK